MRLGLLLLLGTVFPSLSYAQSLTCGPAEPGTVQIDGLLDDWKGVPMVSVGGDPGVSIGCNTEGKTLFFVINVADARFVRTAKSAAGEDHLDLSINGKRVTIYPGDANKIKDKITPAKGIKLMSALQRGGWAVELAVPLSVIGAKSLSAALPYKLVVSDCDSMASLKTEQTAVVEGELQFADAAASVSAFLDERGLKQDQVWLDKPFALGKKNEGRVVGAGKFLAVIDDGYVYRELPIHDKRDLKEVKLLDLAGDGRQAVVLRYVEHGQGAALRELLAIYRFGSEIDRVFIAEIARQVDKNALASKVSWVRRGKAQDLVIEAGTAQGFSADNFREWGGEEIIGIALPWGDSADKKQRYQFSGNEYRRAP